MIEQGTVLRDSGRASFPAGISSKKLKRGVQVPAGGFCLLESPLAKVPPSGRDLKMGRYWLTVPGTGSVILARQGNSGPILAEYAEISI
jgi:hypothetical protein